MANCALCPEFNDHMDEMRLPDKATNLLFEALFCNPCLDKEYLFTEKREDCNFLEAGIK